MLLSAFRDVDQQPDIRALIVTAAGTAFCSGFDLSAYSDATEVDLAGRVDEFVARFSGMVDTVEAVRVPTICAVQGGAVGGGADLALACDLLLASPRAYLANPAATLGFHFYPNGMLRLISRLGLPAAKRLLLAGKKLKAGELEAMGCCTVVAERELPGEALALARTVAAQSPHVTQRMKASLDAASRSRGADQIAENYRESLRDRELWQSLGKWQRRRTKLKQGM